MIFAPPKPVASTAAARHRLPAPAAGTGSPHRAVENADPNWDRQRVSFLAGLPRTWVTIQIPGTAPQRLPGTYVAYARDELPPAPADVADLRWLEHATRHPDDDMAHASPLAARDLSAHGVAALVGGPVPADLARFLRGGGLRDRLRSATDCYFDLGAVAVDVDGGRLIHLISDSQWTYHWLLYVGDDGRTAMVGTWFPIGFPLDMNQDADWLHDDPNYVLAADSFAEFVWRWWMDNEIFYRVVVEKADPTAEQQAYAGRCGRPTSLG